MLSVESNEKLQCQPKVAPMVRIESYPRPIQHGRYGSSRNRSRANWHKHRTIHDKSPLSIMETEEDSLIDAAFRHSETGLSAEASACETIDSLFDDMNNQHISQVQESGFAYADLIQASRSDTVRVACSSSCAKFTQSPLENNGERSSLRSAHSRWHGREQQMHPSSWVSSQPNTNSFSVR